MPDTAPTPVPPSTAPAAPARTAGAQPAAPAVAPRDDLPGFLQWLPSPLRTLWHAFQLWNNADGMRMSAAMSFYGILSLAPLLMILVAMLGWWVGREALQGELIAQIGSVVGAQGAEVVRQALQSAQEPSQGMIATAISFVVLLFGATGVFSELQASMARVWTEGGECNEPELPWWHMASLRLRGVAYVLAFGFLLMVSLALSTLLNLVATWAGHWLPYETVLRVASETLAFAICAALFVAMMRISVGPKPRMRYLVLGSVLGAALFTAGKHILAVYLSTAAVVSAYGAAGSLVVLLMWIYFSSGVLLFAAACARAGQAAEAAPAP